jgi:hypothetical protein
MMTFFHRGSSWLFGLMLLERKRFSLAVRKTCDREDGSDVLIFWDKKGDGLRRPAESNQSLYYRVGKISMDSFQPFS